MDTKSKAYEAGYQAWETGNLWKLEDENLDKITAGMSLRDMRQAHKDWEAGLAQAEADGVPCGARQEEDGSWTRL